MHNIALALGGAWKVLAVGLLLGAGLPALFAVGIPANAAGAGGDAEVDHAKPNPTRSPGGDHLLRPGDPGGSSRDRLHRGFRIRQDRQLRPHLPDDRRQGIQLSVRDGAAHHPGGR